MSLKLKKKILYLIGGSGNIGSDIADKFLKSGFKVVILENIQITYIDMHFQKLK